MCVLGEINSFTVEGGSNEYSQYLNTKYIFINIYRNIREHTTEMQVLNRSRMMKMWEFKILKECILSVRFWVFGLKKLFSCAFKCFYMNGKNLRMHQSC